MTDEEFKAVFELAVNAFKRGVDWWREYEADEYVAKAAYDHADAATSAFAASAASPKGEGDSPAAWPLGTHVHIDHDGFSGTVIGHYQRQDGYQGCVLQQDGSRVVHVYGLKHLHPAPPRSPQGFDFRSDGTVEQIRPNQVVAPPRAPQGIDGGTVERCIEVVRSAWIPVMDTEFDLGVEQFRRIAIDKLKALPREPKGHAGVVIGPRIKARGPAVDAHDNRKEQGQAEPHWMDGGAIPAASFQAGAEAMREACMEAANDERVEAKEGHSDDLAYNMAITHVVDTLGLIPIPASSEGRS